MLSLAVPAPTGKNPNPTTSQTAERAAAEHAAQFAIHIVSAPVEEGRPPFFEYRASRARLAAARAHVAPSDT